MTAEEALKMLEREDYVPCTEKETSLIFYATLYDGDAVMVRQASPDPVPLYVISLDLFAEKFSPFGD